jgi:hypothetical protein
MSDPFAFGGERSVSCHWIDLLRCLGGDHTKQVGNVLNLTKKRLATDLELNELCQRIMKTISMGHAETRSLTPHLAWSLERSYVVNRLPCAAGPGGLIELSGFLYFNTSFIEEFRCEIRPIRPFDCASVGIDRHFQEEIEIFQWLENLAL